MSIFPLGMVIPPKKIGVHNGGMTMAQIGLSENDRDTPKYPKIMTFGSSIFRQTIEINQLRCPGAQTSAPFDANLWLEVQKVQNCRGFPWVTHSRHGSRPFFHS
jgi:hypothetical protein